MPSGSYRVLALPTAIVIVVAGTLFWLLNFPVFLRGEGPQVQLDGLPSSIGSYRATSGVPSDPYEDAHAEKTISRVYESDDKSKIELFLGFNGRQFDENRLQSPKLVFRNGWEYASLEEIQIPAAGAKPIEAIGLLTKKFNARKFVLFWYQVRGQSFSGDVRNRIELIKGLVLHGRTDGAVIRLATPVSDMESLESAKNRLITFSTQLYPKLSSVLPQ